MAKENNKIHPIRLLRESVNSYIANPIILIPFLTIAFIQLFILEILYFAPRYPLRVFFGPIIERFWGEGFLHYPFYLTVIPKIFQLIQIPIYLLFGFPQ